MAAVSSYCTGAVFVIVGLVLWETCQVAAHSPPEPELGPTASVDLSSVLLAVPIFGCAMFGHMNMSGLYAELQPAKKSRAPWVSAVACVASATIYLAVGAAGYLAFGRGAEEDVVAQLAAVRGQSLPVMCIQALLASYLVLKMPFLFLPLRGVTLETLAPGTDPRQLTRPYHMALSAGLLALVYVLALTMPGIGTVLQLLGAICVMPLAFIVPARLSWSLETPRPTARCTVLASFGVVIAVLSLAAMAMGA